MNVGNLRIAMLNITSGGMSKGYRKYLENILPRLVSHPKVSGLLVGIPDTIDFSVWENDFPSIKWLSLKPSIWRWRGVKRKAKRRIEEFGPDIIFIPTARFWQMDGVPVINMIRNMEPLVCSNEGNPIPEIARNWLRVREARDAVNKAERVIAVSEFVKDFLIRHWKISEDRIGIIYHGINMPPKDEKVVRPTSIPKNLDGGFLFTSGSIRPARGLEDAIQGIKNLMPNNNIAGLIIAGDTDSRMLQYRKQLGKKISENKIDNYICWAGSLNEKEMAWCYKNCSIFVVTSRVEACPNIALEAMAHGCVCISADSPPMPEIFANAAVYYPPKDGKALAGVIRNVLTWDKHQRNKASERARKRATEFSWNVCADKTITELAKVARR